MGTLPAVRKHQGGHTSCPNCHFCKLEYGHGCQLAWLHNDGVTRCERGGNLLHRYEKGVVEWLPVYVRAYEHAQQGYSDPHRDLRNYA